MEHVAAHEGALWSIALSPDQVHVCLSTYLSVCLSTYLSICPSFYSISIVCKYNYDRRSHIGLFRIL